MTTVKKEIVAILDAGAQYGKLIDRHIRELNVETELVDFKISSKEIEEKGYKAIIISGGPESVYSDTAPTYDPSLFSCKKPILGICYGMQLINHHFGGKVERKEIREDGPSIIEVDSTSLLFNNLEKSQNVLLTHGDTVSQIANGFKVIALAKGDIIAGIESKEKNIYGVQFHPEVDLTVHGKTILKNFLYNISGLSGKFTMENREEKAIKEIRSIVGDKKVLVLVSGGVDSTVCCALLNKAIPTERVYALHIDNGFMRKEESKKVKEALENLGIKLRVVDATEKFSNSSTLIKGNQTQILCETTNPEEKRKIIGDTFMHVAESEIQKLGLQASEVYLAQGTLRPDLIESASHLASTKADAIKTHHNDTELVRALRSQGRVIEPLKDYHKDEVRELGSSLGLPQVIVWRQPFPGPGLAIRILCAEQPFIDSSFDDTNALIQFILKKSDQVINSNPIHTNIREALHKLGHDEIGNLNGLYGTVLPVQTVGVQGDGRSYRYLVALSGTRDWKQIRQVAKIIPRICHNVNRVVFVFGDKIEGPIKEITPTHLTRNAVTQLQEADDIVNELLLEYQLIRKLSQVPVILFPVGFGISGNRSIAIRPFITNDFMTGMPAIPGEEFPQECLDKIIDRVCKVKGISRLAYDITSKPPGTTEWE